MGGLVDTLGHLASPWAYVIVGTLAALEASAFVGLVIPGELALVTGGYIVHQGHASLVPMLIAAGLGAVVGDSVGYEVGRRLGPRLQRSRLGRRVGDERWARAHDLLERRGGAAVFVGRFVGVLRALVPAVAGTTRMPYRRFLVWNALGGLIWAPGLVLLGALAGSSYQRVEHAAGRAGLILLLVLVVVGSIGAAARWAAHHHDDIEAAVARQMARPPIAGLREAHRRQIDFLVDRFDPATALGLTFTIMLVAVVASAWAFGALVIDLLFDQDVAGPDHATLAFMVDHRAAWLSSAMETATFLGSSAVLVPLCIAVTVVWRRRRGDWQALRLLTVVYLGTAISYTLVKHLTHRSRPPAALAVIHPGGFAFPSGHAAQAAATWGALAFLTSLALTTWPRQVLAWTLAAIVVAVVGLTRLYLGVHWLSDVAAGWALGAFWLFAAIGAHRWVATPHRQPSGTTERLPPTTLAAPAGGH